MGVPLHERQVGCSVSLIYCTKVFLKMLDVGFHNFEMAQEEVAFDTQLETFIQRRERREHKTEKIS